MSLITIQFVTGAFLMFYYVPDGEYAEQSIRYITEQVSYGWYLRSMHRWSANLLFIVIGLHMFRVFVSGSFKRPREMTWVIGALIFLTVIGIGLTGGLSAVGRKRPLDRNGLWEHPLLLSPDRPVSSQRAARRRTCRDPDTDPVLRPARLGSPAGARSLDYVASLPDPKTRPLRVGHRVPRSDRGADGERGAAGIDYRDQDDPRRDGAVLSRPGLSGLNRRLRPDYRRLALFDSFPLLPFPRRKRRRRPRSFRDRNGFSGRWTSG
ncbi:MAG: cytochrome b N-terminal domain-containing protein [Candidatus Manganitrophus sp.]|nr:cytochrome b N-terminal domain-containing protein [Candidatus Manganitrophus sp.]